MHELKLRRNLVGTTLAENTFNDIVKEYEANFLNYISPIEASFFGGKLVLDAGCGVGRHGYYAAKFGAEVVAMDLSKAVEAAYKNTRQFSKVHVVQAEIYSLPFKEEFDYIFCMECSITCLTPSRRWKNWQGCLNRNH